MKSFIPSLHSGNCTHMRRHNKEERSTHSLTHSTQSVSRPSGSDAVQRSKKGQTKCNSGVGGGSIHFSSSSSRMCTRPILIREKGTTVVHTDSAAQRSGVRFLFAQLGSVGGLSGRTERSWAAGAGYHNSNLRRAKYRIGSRDFVFVFTQAIVVSADKLCLSVRK